MGLRSHLNADSEFVYDLKYVGATRPGIDTRLVGHGAGHIGSLILVAEIIGLDEVYYPHLAAGEDETLVPRSLFSEFHVSISGLQYFNQVANIADKVVIRHTLDRIEDLEPDKWHLTYNMLMYWNEDPGWAIGLAETTSALRLNHACVQENSSQ